MSVVMRIRAWPRLAATGAAVAVYLAGGNNDAPHYDGEHYMAGVIADPRFEVSVSFNDDGWAARAVPQSGPIGWMPAEPERLDPLAAYYWRDAAIEIDRIKDGVTTRRLTGTIAEATISDGRLIITCADLSNRLDKPFVSATFAGTGGIEGGDFATGRPKRRSFGRVWNVEGRLLDKVNNIYEFGDPAFPLQSCTALRDKGRAGPLAILGWQGSIAATFAALQVFVPDEGGGAFAPSIACAKWWTQPSGPLTADLQGEASGYAETPAGIAAKLLAAADGPSISNLAVAAALRPGQSGIHIADASETTASALDRLLQRVTLIWVLTSTGDIEVRPWTFVAPVEALKATFISRERTVRPVKTWQVGYRKNERLHGDGEISIALLAGDVVYADGTPIEALKPAEPGATAGAPVGTNVGGRPVTEVLDDLNFNSDTVLEQTFRVDDMEGVLDARTFVEGQPVGTVVIEERTQRTTDIAAINTLLSLLGAKTPDGTAWILDGDTVQVSPGQALASTIGEIAAKTDDHEASIINLVAVLIDNDGVTLKAVQQLNADGHITGVINTNDGTVGDYTIVADVFRLVDPNGGAPFSPFIYEDNVLKMTNVEVDTIKIGSGGTVGGPATTSASAPVAGSGTTAWHTILSQSVTLASAGTIYASASIAQGFPDGDKTWNLRLRINGAVVFAAGGQKTADSVSLSGSAPLPAGTYTVDIQFAAEASVSANGRTLFSMTIY